ncbi:MAG: efflux RND transporter periplasmic adaptor subunit [Bacteroidales bacterium]|nr:efflux RND transporter periplasmic adaptor subunit [Bacteroidales bacterium]
MMNTRHLLLALFSTFLACNNSADQADAYGNFEAIEVIISAEAQGRIMDFKSREGEKLGKDQVIAVIDSAQLHLKKKQLQSGEASLRSKIKTLEAMVHANQVQLANLEREKERIDRLFEGGAATPKQQDDINGQIALLKARTAATESQKASVYAERNTLDVQILQVEDQIWKCAVRSPMDGILLTKYKEEGEVASPGQPLYKMANMDELNLRAYVTGNQLSDVKTGDTVKIRFDISDGMEETTGVIGWISPQAEFTPKIIQTKEERVSLVYAIKVVVPNDGRLKIGMPGEVVF